MKMDFDWNKITQLKPFEILVAFLLPSGFAFLGFRFVLPWFVSNGYPKVLLWGIIASIMLLIFSMIGLYLVSNESKKLKVSIWDRLLLNKITTKQWLICSGIMIIGIIVSVSTTPFIGTFINLTGLSIPDYMPFWLNPSINTVETDLEVLSPNYPLKGNHLIVIIMAITLLLNILAEEIYFRAWLLPKMQVFGKWSWVMNGLLFALYHTFQLWLFPTIIIVSLATSLTVYISKSILPAFVIHLVSNFLMTILGILALVYG